MASEEQKEVTAITDTNVIQNNSGNFSTEKYATDLVGQIFPTEKYSSDTAKPTFAEISGSERLNFAKQVLFYLFLLVFLVFSGSYITVAYFSSNSELTAFSTSKSYLIASG